MSDSFYWLNGQKLYFSTGATEWLYGVWVLLGERRLGLTPDQRTVLSWFRTQWKEGNPSTRAFQLKWLPEELKGDSKLLFIVELIDELLERLARESPQIPDPDSPGEIATSWEERKLRWMWICKLSLLRTIVMEGVSAQNRPSMPTLGLTEIDRLGVEREQLADERMRINKYQKGDPTLLLRGVTREIEVLLELRQKWKDNESARLNLCDRFFYRAELLAARRQFTEAIADIERAIALTDDPEIKDMCLKKKSELQGHKE